jgi:heme/copper-type cytochrome/quinol oxidase subunit 4
MRVKIGANTMARFLFVTVLLIVTVAGSIWYLHSASDYTTYQIDTSKAMDQCSRSAIPP